MKSKQQGNGSTGGIGVLGALGVAFIVLKLMNYINWSWWWVLAPFWAPLGIAGVIFLIIGIVMVIVAVKK